MWIAAPEAPLNPKPLNPADSDASFRREKDAWEAERRLLSETPPNTEDERMMLRERCQILSCSSRRSGLSPF